MQPNGCVLITPRGCDASEGSRGCGGVPQNLSGRRLIIGVVLVAACMLQAFTASGAPSANSLASLSLQGAGRGAIVPGACDKISCKGGDSCACLTATYLLLGNQGFQGGSLDLQLSVDTSVTALPIVGLEESCGSTTGKGTIKDGKDERELALNVSGLECPTIASPDVFNGTYAITGGSGGRYSAATRGTGMISGSQDPISVHGRGAARVVIAGVIQADAKVRATPAPTASATPVPTPTSIATATPTPVATVTPAPTPTRAVTPTPSPVPSPASCAPIYSGTPQGDDAGFFTAISVPAASTVPGCYQIAFVQTDNPGAAYTGYPAGWTPVFAHDGPEQSEIIVHQNVLNEPASNLWTTAGTIDEVYELNISAICNTSGYDGGIIAYSATNAASMTAAAPAIGSSGVNDLTLAFSNMPWNSVVTVAGPSGITGFYTSVPSLGGYWYLGIPQNLSVNVVPASLAFEGAGVAFQAAFAPGSCVTAGGDINSN
jgi:hypothetical protein